MKNKQGNNSGQKPCFDTKYGRPYASEYRRNDKNTNQAESFKTTDQRVLMNALEYHNTAHMYQGNGFRSFSNNQNNGNQSIALRVEDQFRNNSGPAFLNQNVQANQGPRHLTVNSNPMSAKNSSSNNSNVTGTKAQGLGQVAPNPRQQVSDSPHAQTNKINEVFNDVLGEKPPESCSGQAQGSNRPNPNPYGNGLSAYGGSPGGGNSWNQNYGQNGRCRRDERFRPQRPYHGAADPWEGHDRYLRSRDKYKRHDNPEVRPREIEQKRKREEESKKTPEASDSRELSGVEVAEKSTSRSKKSDPVDPKSSPDLGAKKSGPPEPKKGNPIEKIVKSKEQSKDSGKSKEQLKEKQSFSSSSDIGKEKQSLNTSDIGKEKQSLPSSSDAPLKVKRKKGLSVSSTSSSSSSSGSDTDCVIEEDSTRPPADSRDHQLEKVKSKGKGIITQFSSSATTRPSNPAIVGRRSSPQPPKDSEKKKKKDQPRAVEGTAAPEKKSAPKAAEAADKRPTPKASEGSSVAEKRPAPKATEGSSVAEKRPAPKATEGSSVAEKRPNPKPTESAEKRPTLKAVEGTSAAEKRPAPVCTGGPTTVPGQATSPTQPAAVKKPLTKADLLKLITPRSRKDQQRVEQLVKEYTEKRDRMHAHGSSHPQSSSASVVARGGAGKLDATPFDLEHLDLANLDLKALKTEIPEELSEVINKVFDFAATEKNPIVLDDDDEEDDGKPEGVEEEGQGEGRKDSKRRKRKNSEPVDDRTSAKRPKESVPTTSAIERRHSETSTETPKQDDAQTSAPRPSRDRPSSPSTTPAPPGGLQAPQALPQGLLETLLQISLKENELQDRIASVDVEIQNIQAMIVDLSHKLTTKKHHRDMMINDDKRLKAIRLQALRASVENNKISPELGQQLLNCSGGARSDAFRLLDDPGLASPPLPLSHDSGKVINIIPRVDPVDDDGLAPRGTGSPGGMPEGHRGAPRPIVSPPLRSQERTPTGGRVRYLGTVNDLSHLFRRPGSANSDQQGSSHRLSVTEAMPAESKTNNSSGSGGETAGQTADVAKVKSESVDQS